jgi:hypothetical protein
MIVINHLSPGRSGSKYGDQIPDDDNVCIGQPGPGLQRILAQERRKFHRTAVDYPVYEGDMTALQMLRDFRTNIVADAKNTILSGGDIMNVL